MKIAASRLSSAVPLSTLPLAPIHERTEIVFMNPDDIKDEESLREWLKGSELRDAVSIGTRAAFRTLPLYLQDCLSNSRVQPSEAQLGHLRGLLVSGTAAYHQDFPQDVVASAGYAIAGAASRTENAAYSASFAVYAAIGSAAHDGGFASASGAAEASATAAQLIARGHSHIWEQIREDARALSRGEDLLSLPLWSTPHPAWFDHAVTVTRENWDREPELWSFWSRWSEGVLTGKQINWTLQYDIALIPQDDWDKGVAHIAALIAEIEFPYGIARTPNAEVLHPDPVSNLIHAETVSHLKKSHLDDAVDTVLDCASIFDGQDGGNGPYSEMTVECDMLRDAHARYSQRPLMLCRVIKRVLSRTLMKEAKGDVPKDDPYVQDFITTLSSVVGDLMAFDLDVREAETQRETHENTAWRSGDTKMAVTAKGVAPATAGYLHEELIVDAEVLQTSTDVALRSEARYVIKSRLLRILAIVKGSNGKTVAHVEQYPVTYGTLAASILTILSILLG